MTGIHFDEARTAAEDAIRGWLVSADQVEKLLLVRDLFGKLSLAIWSPGAPDTTKLADSLESACGPWWTGDILHVEQADEATRDLYGRSIEEGRPHPESAHIRVLDRHRSRTSWFLDEERPLWEVSDSRPPIVVFYSFKGGLGRSTILAAFSIQRAQAGERVCVLDLDLDSPGVGRLLSADVDGLTSPRGVVDFLLEHSVIDSELSDYHHRCDRVAGSGEIVVFPAGSIEATYPDKLARIDFDEASYGHDGGLVRLLNRVRDELQPQWILLDARTGISESAGRLLSGIAHLHVLLGTTQAQSWQGLGLVLDRLGKEHVEAGRSQGDIILVQAMVPAGETGKAARNAYRACAEQEFSDRYYATADEDSDAAWSVSDLDNQDAPHVPIAVDYEAKLADFRDIADVAEDLCGPPYTLIGERIMSRFSREVDE